MADDKVVIGSNEDTPVKPGDLTKITSVIPSDSAEDDSIATATIPRMKIKPNAPGDSAETSTINKGKIKAKLEEEKPKKKTTVKLKPVVVGETAEAVAVPSQASAAPKVVAAPAPAQATAVPRIASEDETVKIQKPRSVIASTAVPGVKQTIKLRPSSTTPAPISEPELKAATPPPPSPSQAESSSTAPKAVLAGASEVKRTIRLVPKKSDATSGGEQSSSGVRPSAPTIKLEEPPSAVPAEPSRSAATIKLPSESVTDSSVGVVPPKRTLKLKSTKPPEATTVTPRPVPIAPSPFSTPQAPKPSATPMPIPPPSAPVPVPPAVAAATDAEITSGVVEEREIPPVIEEKKEKKVKKESVPSAYEKQEPSIIFTIAACIAFFAMAYFTWMVVGQYCNSYMDSKITVPGLSGKVK